MIEVDAVDQAHVLLTWRNAAESMTLQRLELDRTSKSVRVVEQRELVDTVFADVELDVEHGFYYGWNTWDEALYVASFDHRDPLPEASDFALVGALGDPGSHDRAARVWSLPDGEETCVVVDFFRTPVKFLGEIRGDTFALVPIDGAPRIAGFHSIEALKRSRDNGRLEAQVERGVRELIARREAEQRRRAQADAWRAYDREARERFGENDYAIYIAALHDGDFEHLRLDTDFKWFHNLFLRVLSEELGESVPKGVPILHEQREVTKYGDDVIDEELIDRYVVHVPESLAPTYELYERMLPGELAWEGFLSLGEGASLGQALSPGSGSAEVGCLSRVARGEFQEVNLGRLLENLRRFANGAGPSS